MLSRVSWPSFRADLVIECLKKAVEEKRVRRVCVQALNYDGAIAHVQGLARAIHQAVKVPVSVSCQPANEEELRHLAEAGVERIGIPLDAATKKVFDRVKGHLAGGPYDWTRQLSLLRDAVTVFGKGKVSTHFIVGLGETEEEMVKAVQRCTDMGVLPALFAFTPIRGTALEGSAQPSIGGFRRIQLARHLIVHEISQARRMRFDPEGRLVDWGVAKTTLVDIVRTGTPFLTSGCPDCNRPYYNEKPSGPIYSFPRPLTDRDVSMVEAELTATEA
jgi:biotin synthase